MNRVAASERVRVGIRARIRVSIESTNFSMCVRRVCVVCVCGGAYPLLTCLSRTAAGRTESKCVCPFVR